MSGSPFHRAYYAIKPLLPRRFRYLLRHALARWKRTRVSDIWPIMPGSETAPVNWPGWPEAKRFAFVLTHDVEGHRGLGCCQKLAELEIELGFRSSFNFVPEGEYLVAADLRNWLASNGFEVGVHDHRHDGKLYRSRAAFMRGAKVINRYLKEWNAVGFRAGFMFHNLDWIHELDVRYDASTFDTDPFEPQPHGAGTIFPFWMPPPPGRTGYAELPYTLVQDSTLFLFLREPTIEIWKQKLDWIAKHGGMALLNVHPDYMNFAASDKASADQYPAAFYRQLLEFVRSKYENQYWLPLPKEVASFVSRHRHLLAPGQRSLVQNNATSPQT